MKKLTTTTRIRTRCECLIRASILQRTSQFKLLLRGQKHFFTLVDLFSIEQVQQFSFTVAASSFCLDQNVNLISRRQPSPRILQRGTKFSEIAFRDFTLKVNNFFIYNFVNLLCNMPQTVQVFSSLQFLSFCTSSSLEDGFPSIRKCIQIFTNFSPKQMALDSSFILLFVLF